MLQSASIIAGFAPQRHREHGEGFCVYLRRVRDPSLCSLRLCGEITANAEIAANFQNVDIIVSGYEEQFGIALYQMGNASILQSQTP